MILEAFILANLLKTHTQKIEKPRPVVVQQVIQAAPEPPQIKWQDNVNGCDESKEWIAADPPFYCIPKPIVKPAELPHTSPKPRVQAGNDYFKGYCTYFVATQVKVPAGLHNANQWAINASKLGFTVSTIPIVGSVAQTSAGKEGHVAVVRAVVGGEVLVEEMNVDGWNVVSSRWVAVSKFVYIYF